MQKTIIATRVLLTDRSIIFCAVTEQMHAAILQLFIDADDHTLHNKHQLVTQHKCNENRPLTCRNTDD